MSLSQEQYNKIIDGYTLRRNRAIEKAENNKKKFYEKHPELDVISDRIRSISLEMAKKSILNPNVNKDIYEEEIASLHTKKASILADLGVTPKSFEPVFECKYCQDTGFVNGKRCKCLDKRIIEELYDTSHLGEVLNKENFEHFNLGYYSSDRKANKYGPSAKDAAKLAYQTSWDFIKTFDSEFHNLLIYGETGVGKTFLSHCLAKELLDRGKSVVYLTAFKFFDTLAANKFNKKELSDIGKSEIENCDLLIVDDLGTEMANTFTVTELFAILNERILNKKSVIISTNLTPEEILKTYSERIYSRIYENYELINLIGDDIRIQKSMEGYNG